jgi:hypothetical protein
MIRKRLSARPLALEGFDRGGARRLFGGEFVFRRIRLRFLELEFQLIEKARRALRARSINRAPKLLDFELQMRDQRMVIGGCGPGAGQFSADRPSLGARRDQRRLQRVDVSGTEGRSASTNHMESQNRPFEAPLFAVLQQIFLSNRRRTPCLQRHAPIDARKQIESCAVEIVTVPLANDGHRNRPRSKRFENRHRPWPSLQRHLTRDPRRPRKTKRWPECGSRFSVSWTIRARPSNPLRISVWPVTSHTRTPVGIGIIDAIAL